MKKFVTVSSMLIMGMLVVVATTYSQFWQQNSIPSVNSPVTGLAINSTGTIFAATDGNGLYRSTNKGSTWARLDTFPAKWIKTNASSGLPETTLVTMKKYYYTIAVSKTGDVYAGSYLGEAYRSTDNGTSWIKTTIDYKVINGIPYGSIVTSFAFDNAGNIFAATGGDGVYESMDGAKTWNQLTSGSSNQDVYTIVMDSAGDSFMGTYGDGVYRSTNDGATWNREGFHMLRVNCLVVGKNGRLIAGTDAGVYCDSMKFDTVSRTTVRAGWFRDTLGMPPRTYVISLAATAAGNFFAGTLGGGVYRSTDNGGSWQQLNTGLKDTVVSALAVNDSGFVFAGTRKGGVFASILPERLPPRETLTPLPVPALVSVEQNYPNPFNPSTVIPFTLAQTSRVSLIVYDALGKEVARLADGVLVAGRHEVRWNASSMPSGVYFYRFQSSSATQTGKLILMK